MSWHLLFDTLAALASFSITLSLYAWRLQPQGDRISQAGAGYAISLVIGAIVGTYVLGTANLWVSGHWGLGRSILGALLGAIAAVETYKRMNGMAGSTGMIFVPGFALAVAIGRLGCFAEGLEDFTYGIPSTLPWALDQGDGIRRHPVQLYESLAMLVFFAISMFCLLRRHAWFLSNGFYVMVLFYAGQRFLWEFLKPYQPVAGPFNVFHIGCLILLLYSVSMMKRRPT